MVWHYWEIEKLNKIGEEFMRIGLLANALKAFEAAENKMMVEFIKENFKNEPKVGTYL